ncbi:hypothetical protein KVR01_012972 [Diaporthe batatas]|uniref:uncharacterized protein n=1 Tax=Diaporthe batatas TaxID=748121 RepID=UPI001D039F5F|nr:uncharacterized protein KVR01_012972 [Diaporthe batatas]KAG8157264.1 hypothetical protein KVR01_012972 [Diaporthe batatas]
MSRYRYAPLVTDSEVRLVTILPGVFGDPISIYIKHAQLVPPVEEGRLCHPPLKEIRETLPVGWSAFETLEGRVVFTSSGGPSWTHPDPNYDGYDFSYCEGPRISALRYEALSYTWGNPELCEEIAVAEEHQTHPQQSSPRRHPEKSDKRAIAKLSRPRQLTVRQSLAEVLRHVRYPSEPRTMWIDAICINQNDTNERNNQVKRMGDIYHFAQRVVAWLGPGFPGCDLACSILEYLGQQVDWSRDNYCFPAHNCQEPQWFLNQCPLPYKDNQWDAIQTLVSSQWFKRAWILQEIQLANPLSIIKCGQHEISWPGFRRAILTLWNKSEGIPPELRDMMPLVCGVASHVGGRFEDILYDHRNRLCQDPKDKIYAFTNLIPPNMFRFNHVDYNQEVVDVYRQAFLACCKETQRLELLQYCGTTNGAQDSGSTWVPDWSKAIPFSCSRTSGFSSSGPSMARVDVPSFGKLEVDGIAITSIHKVERPDFTSFMDVIHYLRAKGLHQLETTMYRSGCTLLEAFLHSLTLGLLQDRVDRALCPALDDLRMIVRQTDTEGGFNSDIQEVTSFWQAMNQKYLLDSRVVFTVEGYIGICRRGNLEEGRRNIPICMSKLTNYYLGDMIFVILGCKVPIVLRRTSGGPYQVIGDCFVHGIMDGEAILGPLPRSYHIESRDDGPDFEAFIPVYVENDTQREQRDDPRLQNIPLPPEWEAFEKERTRDDPLIYSMFRSKNTGEVINSDPRLFPEALRERGVPVQRITLV